MELCTIQSNSVQNHPHSNGDGLQHDANSDCDVNHNANYRLIIFERQHLCVSKRLCYVLMIMNVRCGEGMQLHV